MENPNLRILHEHLRNHCHRRLALLKNGFSQIAWRELVDATLVWVSIYNLKGSEVEELLMYHFEQLETPNMIGNLPNNLNIHIIRCDDIRKILISDEMRECIKTILHFRRRANVPERSPYVFGYPTAHLDPLKHGCRYNLLKKYAKECNIDHNDISLRKLRNELARNQ